jgi:hypothetical protein
MGIEEGLEESLENCNNWGWRFERKLRRFEGRA